MTEVLQSQDFQTLSPSENIFTTPDKSDANLILSKDDEKKMNFFEFRRPKTSDNPYPSTSSFVRSYCSKLKELPFLLALILQHMLSLPTHGTNRLTD